MTGGEAAFRAPGRIARWMVVPLAIAALFPPGAWAAVKGNRWKATAQFRASIRLDGDVDGRHRRRHEGGPD